MIILLVLKAYIDQLIMVGNFSASEKKLAGKPVVLLLSFGGGGYHGDKSFMDHLGAYLKLVFTNLGSTDVHEISTEWSLAGVAPGLESFIEQKEKNVAAAKETAVALAKKL